MTSSAAQKRKKLPLLNEVEELDELVTEDSSNVLKILPLLGEYLEDWLTRHPSDCPVVWEYLRPLLNYTKSNPPTCSKMITLPPKCVRKPTKFINVHDEEWEDDYAWLNDRENSQVLKYIEEENEYAMNGLSHTKGLQRLLYKEFVSRLDESEESAKVTLTDGWTYFMRKIPGEEYGQHVRLKDNVEEVYLDENILANSKCYEDASYFRVGFLKHSKDCSLVAYGVDSIGNERHTVSFLNLETKETLSDRIEGVYEDLEFSNDSQYVYYTILDDHERVYQLKRHRLGSPVETDPVLYHETDEMFYLSLTKSCNNQYIMLNTSAQITSETRFLSANDPTAELKLLFPRKEKVQYTCEPHEDHFYFLTNENSKNNWLFRIPIPKATKTNAELDEERETVIEHRDFVLIEDFSLRRHHLIVFERSNCIQNVRIVDLREPGFTSYHYISFSETVYSIWPGSVNEEIADLTKAASFDTDLLRITYTSFIQPKQVIDYHMDERTMTVVHEEKVGGFLPYDQSKYASKRLFAIGVDGTTVPVSIVYRRDLLGLHMNTPITNPCLLHGYGAYGAFVNPIFSAHRLSLLDRGFIYAVAHVRGGADMGNGWYEEGKLAKKPNTFLDFISVAEYLCKEGYTCPEKLAIYGRSAGGLLIGACINMRPDLFRAALTEVPFVDVINTMFDSTIPWTAFEYEEWGNPADFDIYQVMKTYCPYTNIQGELLAREEYPHLLVVGGMNDPRVAFFEPLKFVAKMRGEKRKWKKMLKDQLPTDIPERLLLLKVDDAGHGGNSGQYSHLEDLAFEYAFLISCLEAPAKPLLSGFSAINTSSLDMVISPIGSPIFPSRKNSAATQENVSLGKPKKRAKDEAEDKEYRRGTKGDRGQNKLFQWVANFF